MLVKLYSKILQGRLQQYLKTKTFQVYKLDLEKADEPRSNCQDSLDHRQSKGIPEKKKNKQTTTSASLTMGKPITTNCGKFLEMGIPDHLTCLLRKLYAGQEARESYMEQQTGSNLRKE